MEVQRENSARGIKTSIVPRCSWPLIVENDTRYIGPVGGNKVYVRVTECRCVGQSCIRVRVYRSRCFSWSYVRGFENGRGSYELALEDNYDGDPRTTIYYAVT